MVLATHEVAVQHMFVHVVLVTPPHRSPAPTPTTGNDHSPFSGTDWTGYFVAFAAACLGSILTIAGELTLRRKGEKADYKDAKRQLVVELKSIFRECEQRAASSKSTLILESPLPRSAWTTLTLSGQLRRLRMSQVEQLNEFYRDVNSVNARAALVPMLLQTAALSRQPEVQTAFSEEAQRISTQPYAEIVHRRISLEKALGEGLQ